MRPIRGLFLVYFFNLTFLQIIFINRPLRKHISYLTQTKGVSHFGALIVQHDANDAGTLMDPHGLGVCHGRQKSGH
jgi:hypothetical protein